MIMISSNFILNFTNFYVIVSFFTKSLTLGFFIFNSSKSNNIAKLLILGILLLVSFTLALRAVVAKLVISGILSSIFLILA